MLWVLKGYLNYKYDLAVLLKYYHKYKGFGLVPEHYLLPEFIQVNVRAIIEKTKK